MLQVFRSMTQSERWLVAKIWTKLRSGHAFGSPASNIGDACICFLTKAACYSIICCNVPFSLAQYIQVIRFVQVDTMCVWFNEV